MRHSGPPECYIKALSSNGVDRGNAMTQMSANWKVWTSLMQLQFKSDAANILLESLEFGAPIHLVRVLYERGKWDCQYRPARKYLRANLEVLPDTKSAEDLHRRVKNDSKKNVNRKQRAGRMMDKIAHSKIFEDRNMPHNSAITQDLFLEGFAGASAVYRKRQHCPERHIVDKRCRESDRIRF